ncbi:LPS assembly lipoprotein LptE [Alcaligenes nematophilus]|uniref:LPS-assembly lipoprotein LptE n=1 Tax=Alcaligenes TaxID=507 RepID=UPI0002F199F8|nr:MULTISPECIES: LPS assembly lipoprotein LptE [Alcaligenes]HRO20982.1 LPS assembly lipoprotein LptE [Alcaligenes phenolicus]HRO22161.1 LPS assembly lipoprotein LptE [Alcaligenes phenolicus]HRP12982.1 LPS assembly lipoprotein LptE [Alcaligenes phenolicus]
MHLARLLPSSSLSVPAPRFWGLAGLMILLSVVLTACGFHLKGVAPLPFDTIYTNITDNSAFGANLRRTLSASSPQTRFVERPQDAEAILQQLSHSRNQREISINAKGQVEEYELQLTFVFELLDAKGRVILPPTTLNVIREVPYDAEAVQAKDSEIEMIFRDMEQSLINRIVRRLSSPDVTSAYHYISSQPEASSMEEIELLPTRQQAPL